MNRLATFENELMRLNPDALDFILQVDELVGAVPESEQAALVEPIFKFFEANPLNDVGAPGTLVHLVERFYPSYSNRLLESLLTRPSHNTILMANRILNARLDAPERSRYMAALEHVVGVHGLPKVLRDYASHFLDRRRNLDLHRQ